MKNRINTFVFAFALLCVGNNAFAQSNNFWKSTTQSRTASMELEYRNVTPTNYQLFKLNSESFISTIENAPTRKSNSKSNTIITLPSINGELQEFRVMEASVFSDGLKAKFPSINSYVAQGIDDPSAIARFSVSKVGVHVMITSANHPTQFIDPYTKDKSHYIQYSREDVLHYTNQFECLVDENIDSNVSVENELQERNADDGTLRTFRLALACTGEYATYHLNQQGVPTTATDEVKKEAVLSAMNVSMTRVNGVFERDVAISMEIIPNNTDIIFLNAATDGYTNNDPFALLDENQNKCDGVIGNANYDIGHVFSTQGGGVAQLNSPCVTGSKARGVTGIGNPIGDFYDIDYVAHEMGHQYGGQHTQNNNCQRSGSSVEPGSASTIMGYAGICPPNVQNNSDDYFNGVNVIQMWNNITFGNSTCATPTDTNNDPPVADAGSNYQIPASTPFILEGAATDPNGADVLTYCWEQIDPQAATMPPSPTSTSGPNFRSLDPSLSTDRFMPAIETVLAGNTQTTWEVVPAVTRIMTFRLTVRDNVANGASSSSDAVAIFTNDTAGPFVVTSQTAPTTEWVVGTTETVTWDVANTTAEPINAANVDILMSTDGGQTFDVVVLAGTPNDGSQEVNVPNLNTTEARLMVRGSENIFYNVNATNFEVSGELGTSDFDLEDLSIWPNPSSGNINISFTAQAEKVELSLYDLRGRRITSSNYNAGAGSNFNQSIDYSTMAKGMYFIQINNGDSSVTKRIILK